MYRYYVFSEMSRIKRVSGLGFVPIWLGSAIELAECRQMTLMITPANRNAAVIIVNRRRNHEFVIIASVYIFFTMIILTVRTHGQQPQKTDIYRAHEDG